jgi:outer membrane protein assembly factor BamA
VKIKFSINKGKLAYIERIEIVGNDRSADKVVRRVLYIREGESVSPSGHPPVEGCSLMRMGYFDEVAIKWRRGGADDLVIVDLEVKERYARQLHHRRGLLESGKLLRHRAGQPQQPVRLRLEGFVDGRGRRVPQELPVAVPRALFARFAMDLRHDLTTPSAINFSFPAQGPRRTTSSFGRPLYWTRGAPGLSVPCRWKSTDVDNRAALFLNLAREGQKITTSTRFTLQRDTVKHPFDPTAGAKVSASTEWAS